MGSTITTPGIATVNCMRSVMASDPLYRLLAWLSPSYPVGAFSYSHGVETAGGRGV